MKRYLLSALFFLLTGATSLFALDFDADTLAALEMLHNSGEKTWDLLGNRKITVLHGFRKIEPDGSGIVLIGGQSQGDPETDDVIAYNLIIVKDANGNLDVSMGSLTSMPELKMEDWFDEKTLFALQFLHNAGFQLRTELGSDALRFMSGSRDFVDNQRGVVNLTGTTTTKAFVLTLTGKFSGEELNVSITYPETR